MNFHIAPPRAVPPLSPTKRIKKAKTREDRQAQHVPDALRLMIRRALRSVEEPKLGTVIGRMRVDGVITQDQYAAAESYSRLRARYDGAMGIPRRSARSPIYDDVVHGPGVELPERVLRELKSDHQRMIATTRSAYPILDRVILDGEEPAEREMDRLRHALDRMCWFFGIGG